MASLHYYLDSRATRKSGEKPLKVCLTHNRDSAYYSTGIFLKKEDWDSGTSQVVNRPDRKFLNVELRKMFADFLANLARIERRGDFSSLTPRQVLDMVVRGTESVDRPEDLDYVVPVFNEYIGLCKKTSTAQVYKCTLKNIAEFAFDIDSLRFKDINVAWLRKYQNWLTEERGMETNGANVYLRNLRTIFNYAINNQFTSARYPFKDIDMSTTEPDKRDVPYEKFIEWVCKPMPDSRGFYRDLFMLSFYLCGIRPVDLLMVKKKQVVDGRLVYYPEKLNGRTKLSIKIEPEAWEIIHRYEGKEYLINIMETRSDYKAFCKHWNIALRCIGEDSVGLKKGNNNRDYTTVIHKGIIPYITIYYARTCFASYLYNVMDTPMDIISQALGHKSGLRVTNFYVKRDKEKVDIANRKLIDKVKKDCALLCETA